MSLRQLPDGRWRMQLYVDGTKLGRRVQRTFPKGTTWEEADRAHKRAAAKAADRRASPLVGSVRFDEVAADFCEAADRLTPKTTKAIRAKFKTYLTPFFGRMRLDALRPRHLEDYQRKRTADGAAPRTVNLELQLVRQLVLGALRDRRIDVDPLPRGAVRPLRTPRSRTEFLSPADWSALEAAAEEEARPILAALLHSACRLNEVVRLTWADVDLEAGRVTFRQAKTNDRPKTLPLRDEDGTRFPLGELLEALPRGTPAGRVFTRADGRPWTDNQVQRRFYEARDRAGLRRSLSVHALRHTAASWLAAAGTALPLIQRQLGHTSPDMTSRYYHLQPEALRDVARTLAAVEKSGRAQFRRNRESGTISENRG